MTIDRREPPRVRGYEQYWVPYLKLVADLTTGRPVAITRAEIAESFAKRNCDKRLTDWEMIDGDGKHCGGFGRHDLVA